MCSPLPPSGVTLILLYITGLSQAKQRSTAALMSFFKKPAEPSRKSPALKAESEPNSCPAPSDFVSCT
jgi:hypothetical protein